MITHLPPLARLESLELEGDGVGDDSIPNLARQPRLKSLTLWGTNVTPEGLKQLASLAPLEELSLYNCPFTFIGEDPTRLRYQFPEALESLVALRALGKLHAGRNVEGRDEHPTGEIVLGDGGIIALPPEQLARARRALQRLRATHPGIVVDGMEDVGVLGWEKRFFGPRGCFAPGAVSLQTIPVRHVSWLPRCAPPMSAASRGAFEANGGWVRFDAAGYPERDVSGRINVRAVSFD